LNGRRRELRFAGQSRQTWACSADWRYHFACRRCRPIIRDIKQGRRSRPPHPPETRALDLSARPIPEHRGRRCADASADTGIAMKRTRVRTHADIRIRAARSWSREHGEEPPHVALSDAEKAELARLAQIIEYKTAGSQILAQGEEAGFIYLLADGVVRTHHSLRNGERQILAFHWPGKTTCPHLR
jgi:hypothetical protein